MDTNFIINTKVLTCLFTCLPYNSQHSLHTGNRSSRRRRRHRRPSPAASKSNRAVQGQVKGMSRGHPVKTRYNTRPGQCACFYYSVSVCAWPSCIYPPTPSSARISSSKVVCGWPPTRCLRGPSRAFLTWLGQPAHNTRQQTNRPDTEGEGEYCQPHAPRRKEKTAGVPDQTEEGAPHARDRLREGWPKKEITERHPEKWRTWRPFLIPPKQRKPQLGVPN